MPDLPRLVEPHAIPLAENCGSFPKICISCIHNASGAMKFTGKHCSRWYEIQCRSDSVEYVSENLVHMLILTLRWNIFRDEGSWYKANCIALIWNSFSTYASLLVVGTQCECLKKQSNVCLVTVQFDNHHYFSHINLKINSIPQARVCMWVCVYKGRRSFE